MEKTPAADAMEWSVELEKGLRSKSSGKCIEAISRIGPRLEWWNRQSEISVAEYKIFGLVPGEDKLFLNAILLRLADAFRIGDKQTKYCIVKIFMQELKCRRKRGGGEKWEKGIFSRNKLDNYLEILRRVKIVFDDGDVEERALALYLFGCWADFAKDNADIRYVILSSSVSNDNLEMKASLFAAGRFCELANDFGSVLLEMLANRLKSCETSTAFKLAGGQIFAKMRCSFSLANRAYKTGLKLISDSSDQKFSLAMLISLTKIASRWTLLIPLQMELFSTFLVKDGSMHMQATTLKCLQCVLATGVCPSLEAGDIMRNLINILSESKIAPVLLCKALKVLHQILLYNLPTFQISEMLEVLSMLLSFFENIFQTSIVSERVLCIWVLLDILGKFLGRTRLESNEIASALACQIISFMMDHLSVLLKSKVDGHQPNEEMEQEITSLIRLLLNLIENHSDVCALVLDKVTVFMKHLVDILGDVSMEKEGVRNYVVSESVKEEKKPISLKLVVLLTKTTNICLENLEAENAIPHDIFNQLKLLVDFVLMSATFQLHTNSVYMLLLHFHGAYMSIWHEVKHRTHSNGNCSLSCGDFFIQYDSLIVEYAKKIFERRDYWSFYKAGKHATCQGSWSTATFIFEQLMEMVLSDPNYLWLNSLAIFSRAESQIEFFGHLVMKDSLFNAGEGIAPNFNLCNYAEVLVKACNSLRSAGRTLETSIPGLTFKFQKWFLDIRAKFLEIMIGTARLLGAVSFLQETTNSRQKEVTVSRPSLIPLERLSFLVHSLSQISCQLKKLANEYDLLAVSFVGMDTGSAMRISVLAGSCSLLAFSTAFALSIPYSYASGESVNCSLGSSEEQFRILLIQDLLERLYLIDCETSKNLSMLLKFYRKPTSCFLPQSRNQALGISHKARCFIKICRYAVMGIVGLQNEASKLGGDESISKISIDGFQLLLRIIFEWVQIPFRCPSYFFQVRHNVSSELFVVSEEGENIDGTSVSSGSHLSIHLCLQLKNMPSYLPAQLAKLYCILSCTIQPPQRENKEQSSFDSEKWETDEVLDLNEKLARYVTRSATSNGIHIGTHAFNSLSVEEYLHFQPNERGQGFSTCLLDISALPVGIYRIQWHSCFVDNEGSYWSLLPLNSGPSFNIV